MKVEWKSCFRIGVSIFLLYLCIQYWPSAMGFISTILGAAAPLIIGCAIAYVVNILMSFYEKYYFSKSNKAFVKKSRRPVCMLAAIITLLAVMIAVITLVVPQLTECVQLIFAALPNAITSIVKSLDKTNLLPENIMQSLTSIDWQSTIEKVINVVTSGVGDVMDILIKSVSSVFSGIVTAFLSIIFSIYILLDRDTLGKQCTRVMKHYLKSNWCDKIFYVLSVLNDCFRRYIIGQCTEAVILGVLCSLGMLLLQLPYATMIGALIAFTALIPVAGGYIGGGIGALMIFSVSPMQALVFIIYLVILQQLEGNLVYPRVVGSSLGLPAIWVLAAVTVGGGMMGIAGMLFGVPIAAALYRLLKEDLNRTPELMQVNTAE